MAPAQGAAPSYSRTLRSMMLNDVLAENARIIIDDGVLCVSRQSPRFAQILVYLQQTRVILRLFGSARSEQRTTFATDRIPSRAR